MMYDDSLYAPVGKGAQAMLDAAWPVGPVGPVGWSDYVSWPPNKVWDKPPKRIELYFAREKPYRTYPDRGICGPLPFRLTKVWGDKGQYLTYSSVTGDLEIEAYFYIDIFLLKFHFCFPPLLVGHAGPSYEHFLHAWISMPKLSLFQYWSIFKSPEKADELSLPMDDHIFPRYQKAMEEIIQREKGLKSVSSSRGGGAVVNKIKVKLDYTMKKDTRIKGDPIVLIGPGATVWLYDSSGDSQRRVRKFESDPLTLVEVRTALNNHGPRELVEKYSLVETFAAIALWFWLSRNLNDVHISNEGAVEPPAYNILQAWSHSKNAFVREGMVAERVPTAYKILQPWSHSHWETIFSKAKDMLVQDDDDDDENEAVECEGGQMIE
jgi:hypothetical protein